eukprot:TRINITY_DN4434_c0_g1_i12.p1 TRINITY_DN4434_c0_g1~~TRINITY_DN4434_c0_g1_i12.p1  ORF type:complete len:541 (-),score=97.99 TRINITY_DN4434_c0_g1_i12:616-2238(-)
MLRGLSADQRLAIAQLKAEFPSHDEEFLGAVLASSEWSLTAALQYLEAECQGGETVPAMRSTQGHEYISISSPDLDSHFFDTYEFKRRTHETLVTGSDEQIGYDISKEEHRSATIAILMEMFPDFTPQVITDLVDQQEDLNRVLDYLQSCPESFGSAPEADDAAQSVDFWGSKKGEQKASASSAKKTQKANAKEYSSAAHDLKEMFPNYSLSDLEHLMSIYSDVAKAADHLISGKPIPSKLVARTSPKPKSKQRDRFLLTDRDHTNVRQLKSSFINIDQSIIMSIYLNLNRDYDATKRRLAEWDSEQSFTDGLKAPAHRPTFVGQSFRPQAVDFPAMGTSSNPPNPELQKATASWTATQQSAGLRNRLAFEKICSLVRGVDTDIIHTIMQNHDYNISSALGDLKALSPGSDWNSIERSLSGSAEPPVSPSSQKKSPQLARNVESTSKSEVLIPKGASKIDPEQVLAQAKELSIERNALLRHIARLHSVGSSAEAKKYLNEVKDISMRMMELHKKASMSKVGRRCVTEKNSKDNQFWAFYN